MADQDPGPARFAAATPASAPSPGLPPRQAAAHPAAAIPPGRTRRGRHFGPGDHPLAARDLAFSRCTFEGCSFEAARASGATFSDCRFRQVSFIGAHLQDCAFTACTLQESMWVDATLAGVRFDACHLEQNSFEGARFSSGCRFSRCLLPGTHFLAARIEGCRIDDCDLADAHFFGAEAGFEMDATSRASRRQTRPAIATLVALEGRGITVPLVGRKIAEQAGSIPLRVAMRSAAVAAAAADAEVHAFLDSDRATTGAGFSPAHRLVAAAIDHPATLPQAARLVDKARRLLAHVDAVVLPGGEDVPPALYGAPRHPLTDFRGDYRRSLLELALIHLAWQRQVPLMAICRGFQMTAVYFGARLRQHVGPQVGVRILGDAAVGADPAPAASVFGTSLHDIRTAVYHHQAIAGPGDRFGPLQASLRHALNGPGHAGPGWQMVMALEPADPAAPIIGLQFHPEFFSAEADIAGGERADDNAELERMANAWQAPGAAASGVRHPADLQASGLLSQMSAGNDALWHLLADAARAHGAKRSVSGQALREARAGLRPASARPVPALP